MILVLVKHIVTVLLLHCIIEAIKPWWQWAYWLSPLMYGQRAISVNEFSASRWSKVCILAGIIISHYPCLLVVITFSLSLFLLFEVCLRRVTINRIVMRIEIERFLFTRKNTSSTAVSIASTTHCDKAQNTSQNLTLQHRFFCSRKPIQHRIKCVAGKPV